MKKLIISGAFATALIVGGGTGVYMAYAKENTVSPVAIMQQQGMNMEQMSNSRQTENFEEMQQFMKDGNVNFGQMKPYMKQMHPDLSDKQLEAMYKRMHGTGGACNSKNFEGMMGNL
jgi:Ethanolamine utilization protein EutJ (predicted chaperonin)